MHVALISDVTSRTTSGVDNSTRRFAEQLAQSGLRVTLVGGARPGPSAAVLNAADHGIDTRTVGFGRAQLLVGFRPWVRSVHRELETLDADLVHGQGTLHNGIAAALWQRCPTLVTAHGNPIRDAEYAYSPAVRAVVRPLLTRTVSRIVRSSDVIVNVTTDWRVNLPLEPERSVHIPNPVDSRFYTDTTPARIPVIHYFGGSRSIKGPDLLAAAWPSVLARIPAAELRVYGAEDARLCELFAGSGASLRPTCDSAGVASAMAEGGIVVVPSRFEVSPLVIGEAWASRIPVVATAVGGIPAMAQGAAVLTTPDAASIANALVEALSDTDALEPLVAEGVARTSLMTPRAVVDAHVRLYQELVGGTV